MTDIVFAENKKQEVIEDEFDMTDIAKNLGVYHEAPKQERQYLDVKTKNDILQEVIKEMDAEDKSKMTDEEVEHELLKRLQERLQKAQDELTKTVKNQEQAEEKKRKSKDWKYFPKEDQMEEVARTMKLQGGDLHHLNIDKSEPRGQVLDVIKTMAQEVEQIMRGKKPFDWGETPCFLTIKRWNETIGKLCEDEYWAVDLKDPYDLQQEVAGQVDEDLVDLINDSVRVFSFYRKKSNFQEKDGVWKETNGERFVKLHTKALELIKRLRKVLPNNKDKLFGFKVTHPFNKKSLEAYKQRREMATEDEIKLFDSYINAAMKEIEAAGKTPKATKQFIVDGALIKVMKGTMDLDVDENDIHLLMAYFMTVEAVVEKALGQTVPELAKVKTDDKELDAAFNVLAKGV